MPSIRLVSLNVERSKHIGTILPFLARQKPDVACFQEFCESDIPFFERVLGMECFFTPFRHNSQDGPQVTEGIGVFSRLTVLSSQADFYVGDPEKIPTYAWSSREAKQMSDRCALVALSVNKDGTEFQIATTHFVWTPDGQPDEPQRRAFQELERLLDTKDDIVLCGDFNAPRGGEIFSALAKRYVDNIPQKYVTSLDRKLHRAGHLDRMVDGLFSTPVYQVTNVELVDGLSDHCAITATISRTLATDTGYSSGAA